MTVRACSARALWAVLRRRARPETFHYPREMRGNSIRRALILIACGAAGAALIGIAPGAAASDRGVASRSTTLDIDECKPRVQANFGFVEIGFTDRANRVPSRGTVKVATVFVDFPDSRAKVGASSYFDSFVPQGLGMIEGYSYGRVQFAVTRPDRWFTLPKPSTDYAYSRGMTGEGHHELIADAVAIADPFMDFSGASAVIVVMPPDLPGSNYEVSPAFVSDPSLTVNADGARIMNGTTIGTDAPHMRPQVLAHEILHTMGLIDLYHPITRPEDFELQFKYTGPFSSMSNIGGLAPELFAWERWVLDWIDDGQSHCLGAGSHDITLDSVALPTKGSKLAVVPRGGTEYLTLEARTRDGRDSRGFAGVLPYVVDPSIPTSQGALRVPSQPGPQQVMMPLPVGSAVAIEGIGIEVLRSTGSGFETRVHVPAPGPTTPGPVGQLRIGMTLGGLLARWSAPLQTGWTSTTGYEYRIGNGPWMRTTDTSVRVTQSKKSRVFQVRAVNAVGPGQPSTASVRPR